MKARTPDEKFLIALYRQATALGEPEHPILIRKVAQAISYKETAVKNIVKFLAQANFVKKVGEDKVSLTPRGLEFVLRELEESS